MPKIAPAPSAAPTGVVIPPLQIQTVRLTVVGDSPLICHAWSEKAKKQMLDTQMKRARGPKAAKDPEADYADSLYRLPGGGYGFPAVAFKSAIVDAASYVEGVTKVALRGAFFIAGELVPIEGEPSPREDMVRVGMGTADIRYRGEFKAWRAALQVQLNPAVLSLEQLMHLVNLAGFSIGVGEWRPQKDGMMGRFHVATPGEA